MTTLIIDGDPIAYRAASVGNAENKDPAQIADNMVAKLMRELRGDRAIIAISDRSRVYWRHDLDPTYKQGRSGPPDNIERAREGLAGHRRTVKEIQSLEADDIIGILATDDRVLGRKIIVASDDHMMTIPGEHHRPKKFPAGKTVRVSVAEAECRHLQQTLMTIKGVGPAYAEKHVTLFDYTASPAAAWQNVVDCFVGDYRLKPSNALLAARIARVCRVQEFNFETLTVVPWQPPTSSYSVHFTAPESSNPSQPVSAPVADSLFVGGHGPDAGWVR